MDGLILKRNELSADEFIELWETIWGQGPSPEQTRLAMEHTLFRVSLFDGDKIVAMARVIGDMGLDYYIKDVIVRPEYQRKGILFIAAAIGDDKVNIERIYGNSFLDITDLSQLPVKLTSIIRKHLRF